jgi:CspA family cold shock protein
MKTGTVNWFNNCLGYGFIKPDDGGEDVYVHHSETETDSDFLSFEEGQKVEYDLIQDTIFPFAAYVHMISSCQPQTISV